MGIINRPTPDPTSKGTLIIPAGATAFLPVALKEGSSGPLVPLDADWESVGASIFAIVDPDDGAISGWNTNDLDPSGFSDNGDADTYDADHATYVGDLFTPEIPGLFAPTVDGSGNPIRLALKVMAPSAAEQTSSNSSRNYGITWSLKKNGNVVLATEAFNIGPSAIPVFADVTVTWTEVTATLSSSITSTTQQDAIINEAAEYVRGILEEYAIDPDNLPLVGTRSLKTVMLQYARLLVRQYDSTAGSVYGVTEIREALDTIKFGGRSTSDLSNAFDRFDNRLLSWIQRAKADRFFEFSVATPYEAVA